MILQTEVRGIFATNFYFYIDDETRHGFLIYPGAQADELLKIIVRENFTIEKILLTHGHFDHIGAVNELQAGHTTDGAICKRKILMLLEETILLSGHSAPTTVGNEKNRPWFSE